jgi:putative flippase GtrA
MKRLISAMFHLLTRYGLKFGVIGIIAYVVDVGVFNVLRLGVLGENVPWSSPLGARVVAFVVSTVVAWLGNRYWTFRKERRGDTAVEFLEFVLVALAGLGIVLGCLYLSHYVFGFTSLLADNVSSNVIGFIIATAFRFVLYRYWVYGDHRKGRLDRQALPETPGPSQGKASAEPPHGPADRTSGR